MTVSQTNNLSLRPSYLSVLLFAFLRLFEEARIKDDKFVSSNDIKAELLCDRPFRERKGENLVNV